MEQRLSLITLGVADLERAITFYRGLGWEPHPASVPGAVAFYQLDGSAFALWSRAELAADSMVDDAGGWGGVTLAHNVRSLSGSQPHKLDNRCRIRITPRLAFAERIDSSQICPRNAGSTSRADIASRTVSGFTCPHAPCSMRTARRSQSFNAATTSACAAITPFFFCKSAGLAAIH